MKKIMVTFLAICLLVLIETSFGQTKPITISSVSSIEDKFTFLSVKSARNDKTKEMQMTENVSFTSEKFEFFGANKVIYNETTKKMTVFNCQGFTINGKVVIKNGEKLSNILEYTIGSDTVYLF